MLSKKGISICGIVVCLFFFLALTTTVRAADTIEQVLKQIDEVLKENPLKPDEKVQRILIAQDDTITFLVLRAAEGVIIKPHVHKTHDETVYVIRGTGQMLINGKWIDIKPGSLHFNPMGKPHSTKITGSEPAVVLSIFTPGLKQPDMHFVE